MGNGFSTHGRLPPGPEPIRIPVRIVTPPRRRVKLPLLLFLLTIVSTLTVGAHLTRAFEQNQYPYTEFFSWLDLFGPVIENPFSLLSGWPFALALMGILLAHELGHYFACRIYGIHATYPYFLPAPTLIGTMGAFIRIQSPIVHRRALFDVGIAGPLVGFAVAVPALIVGILYSKAIPGTLAQGAIVFGNPPLVELLAKLLRPDVPLDQLFLHPIGRAAWVGLFATALNLLPVGQLDGGHILYAVAPSRHRSLSRLFIFLLFVIGLFGLLYPEAIWFGWTFWGILLRLMGTRHPTVLEPVQTLDRKRLWVAALGLLVFLLCFTPVPFHLYY